MPNIRIEPEELQAIRALDDFDLTMLLSEINDHGWAGGGKVLLPDIIEANRRVRERRLFNG